MNKVFHALADTTRRQILLRIREQDQSVNDIADEFSISLPAISKHLKVLEQAGLISRIKAGQKRLCHLEPSILQDAHAWLEFYQAFWNQRLDNLTDFLEQETRFKEKQ